MKCEVGVICLEENYQKIRQIVLQGLMPKRLTVACKALLSVFLKRLTETYHTIISFKLAGLWIHSYFNDYILAFIL
jgi:hypothetical protein